MSSVRVGSTGLLLVFSQIVFDVSAQDFGSLPAISAPSAYGENVTTGIAAASSSHRALSPPPGITGDADASLQVGLSIGAAWHSNPERRDDDFESDAALLLSPSLSYTGNLGRHQYQFGYSEGQESYGEFETEDSDWHRFTAALRLDLSDILIGDIYASRTEGEEERGAAGSRESGLIVEDEYRGDVLGGRLTLGRRSNPLQVYVGLEVDELSFLNNDQFIRDRDRETTEAGLFYNISPKSSIFLRARESNIDYLLGNPSLDSTETSLTAGFTWEVTEIISLTLEAGNLEKKFDDPALIGYDGSTVLGKVSWSPRDRTQTSLYYSRTTEESSDADASFYLSDVYGIDVSQQVGQRGTLSAHYARSENDYSNNRLDEITDYGISFGYGIFTWGDIGASYNVIEYNSNEAGESYDDEIFSIFFRMSADLLGGD